MKVSTNAVIGIYENLARAEKAELRLEEAYLPVGQMTLIAPEMEDGEVTGAITARQAADVLASSGVQFGPEQVDKYEQVLQKGKHLLIFSGNVNQVAQAHQALEHTDNDELTLLGG
jgi:tRNA A58 N-methylase Trm61